MGMIKDPTSWRVGFELGLAGFSFPYSKPRKPTAYLYNGIRLPALPEWDRKKYPYAMVGCYAYVGTYWLYVLSEPAHDSVSGVPNTANGGAGMCFVCEIDKWELAESWGTEGPDSPIVEEVWVNYDYLASDGVTVKLAASTPVPVYE